MLLLYRLPPLEESPSSEDLPMAELQTQPLDMGVGSDDDSEDTEERYGLADAAKDIWGDTASVENAREERRKQEEYNQGHDDDSVDRDDEDGDEDENMLQRKPSVEELESSGE